MTDVAYPAVYAALLAVAQSALSDSVRVVDGYDISDDPGDVLLLGVPNLADAEGITAGTFDQEQMTHGSSGAITETGSISGIALAWVGDTDANLARTTAFGYISALNAAIRADRSLGITDFNLVVFRALSGASVAEDKVSGATCAVSFAITYTAII